jgi:hypothetical protein
VRDFLSEHRVWAVRVGAGVGLAFIVLLIHRAAYGMLGSQPQFRVKPVAKVQVAPMWAAGESTVEMPADLSLFDDGLVARVARRFEENAWVKRVTLVERVFPDRIRVRFETRRPHVAVRRAEGLYLLDVDGVRLPGVYVSAPSCARTAQIVGVASAPPAPGAKWQDADVRAGVELVELIAATPQLARLGVASVDVSNAGGRADRRRPETSLVLANGCMLHWGRPPSSSQFGEPTPQEKLALLGAVVEEYPKLDGLKYVKLQGGAKAAVVPLPQNEARLGKRTPR